MTNLDAIFLWLSIWFYGFSFVSYLFGLIFKKDRAVSWGWNLAVLAFSAHTLSIIARWWITGHPPVKTTYENSMLGGWFIAAPFVFVRSWKKGFDVVGVVVVPAVVLMIGHGAMTSPVIEPLSPPYKSNWLWFHIFFAWIAYGAFFVGAGLGALYLLKEKKGDSGFFGRLPSIEDIDDTTLKVIMFGFICLTVEIGAGAIWAYGLWGRYWGWDPIEVWSLITWLVYGTYIHLGATLGWKGRRMAWLVIFALIFVYISFGGIGYLGGIHTTIL